MIKVLYIYSHLKQRFGVTSVIMNYLEFLSSKDMQIDLLVYQDSEAEIISKAKSFGANIFFMPELGLKNLLKYRHFIQSFFSKHKYHVVHSHFNQIDGIVFPIARQCGVQCCISHSHNTRLSDFHLRAIRNRLLCWNISKNADILAACSEKAGVALYGSTFKYSPKKLIINNGINVEKFIFNSAFRQEIRKEFKILDDEILLGHIGSFKPQKNQEYLIKIFDQLCRKYNKYKLLLIGDGEDKTSIQQLVKSRGLDKKIIFGGVRADVHKILSAIDLLLLPSLYEGLPVIGIEAQASGLECLFSDTITRESNLTEIKFLPLKQNPNNWVEQILRSSCEHHTEYAHMVSDKGYDIRKESNKLKVVYKKFITNK